MDSTGHVDSASVVAFAVLVVLAACQSAPPPAAVAPAQEELSPEVIHARAAAILSYGLPRRIPAGDTFVTWTPKPALYTTVSRTASTVASSLVSLDGVVGTAESVWEGGLQREVSIRWTQNRATLMELNVRLAAGVIHLAGVRDTALQAPSLPWAVADYGMEDQILPLIQAAGVEKGRLRLAIFRPRASRWDTITIACRRAQGATLATVTAPDGERFFWTITGDGALVRLTRDRDRDFERRPLDMSERVADYLRLRELWKH